MEKNAQELYNERVARLKTTINLEEPDRVPVYFPCETWLASYGGYTVQEMVYDYGKLLAACEKTIQEFQWDCVWTPLGVWPAPIFDAVGQSQYEVAGEHLETGSSFQWPDVSPMAPEEYPEFIANPYTFIIEKLMPRRAKELAKPWPRNAIALAKAALAFGQYLNIMGAGFQRWAEVYGMPLLLAGLTQAPMDIIEDQYRGFRGIVMDIKRRPDDVIAACEALLPYMIEWGDRGYLGPPGVDFPLIFIPIHIPTFLRPADFEKFYWPTFRALLEALAERGRCSLVFFEGDWEPYLEYLTQLPKGKVVGLFEQKVELIKKALEKNMCVAGGIPDSLLGYGTEEECVAHAKKVIDACAPGGGFIFSSDKALLSPNDAKPENLAAVTKFIKEYGVYKK